MNNKKIIIITILIGTFLSLLVITYPILKAEEDKIADTTKSNEIKNNLTVYAYIDGETSATFPTTNNYNTNIICKSYAKVVTDVAGTAKWNGSKWQFNLANLNTGNAICNVYFTSKSSTLVSAPNGWYEAETNTLLGAIRNNNTVTSPLTTPGVEVSTNEEAVLASTPDDYGTSYYFRGNVQNNYVVFAEMCWRIVRITGDGSIKLVLYNYSSTDCTETGDDLAFARYSGTTYTTAFNTSNDDNAHVGFMYGQAGASTYAETHKNKFKSTILMNLETWYKSKLSNYENKLADVIWCNDKSTSSGAGYSASITTYSAPNRYQNHTPSLICPNDNEGGKLSKFTVSDIVNGNGNLNYKIGLLTLDEAIFAGENTLYKTNTNVTYLRENIGDNYWWLLSPVAYQNDGNAYLFNYDNAEGYLTNGNLRDGRGGLRPSIALKSTTTISSGTGTASGPFVIS